jgi:hypothetical protein
MPVAAVTGRECIDNAGPRCQTTPAQPPTPRPARCNTMHLCPAGTQGVQGTRARILLSRCLSGSIYVATASLPLGPYQIVYGWGALVKALVPQRAC